MSECNCGTPCEDCGCQEQEVTIKRIPAAKYLRESGLLFQINRDILHPLGLALEVTVNEDGTEEIKSLWDCRNDAEGIIYDQKTFERGQAKLDKFYEEFGENKIQQRIETIGYAVQNFEGYTETFKS